MPGHIQLSTTTWGSQDLRLLLVSSSNLQRSLFVKGEEPWPWLYFSYRVGVASGEFYVQLLLMGWQAQFSIISQEFAAQFMSEEHFQSFYMMVLSSEICNCCYETNLFLSVRQIYSWRPGAAIFRKLFWNNPVFLLLFSSYPFLSFFDFSPDEPGPWTNLSFDLCFIWCFLFSCVHQPLGYTCLTKHKEVKQRRKFKLKFKCSAPIKLRKIKPIT